MKSRNRGLWQAILVYILLISALLGISLYLNDGHFVYALDDAYIHMSMADNFVNYGHWATNKIEFASASSSPLWVLILSSVYAVFGENTPAPFILNLLFQFFAIAAAYYILRKFEIDKYLVPFLLAFILITPMPAMLFSGMEHSAQLAFTLVFVFIAIESLSSKETDNKKLIILLIAALLFAGIRYEDMVLLSIMSLLFFFKGKRWLALMIFITGLMPLVIYGVISTSHGWLFIPNTLLLKSGLPEYTAVGLVRFAFKAFRNITEPHVFVLLIIMAYLYIFNLKRYKSFWDKKQLLLVVSAVTLIINMSIIEYNHNGSFYRYEAYLIALSILAILISIYDLIPHFFAFLNSFKHRIIKFAAIGFLLVVITPLAVRAFTLFGIPHASMEYHNQQYQMAQFCKLYAKDMNIALNDIGMVNYYTENKVTDLLGLSDIEVAKQRLNRTYNTRFIEELGTKENVRLVICYEHWFDEYGGLPASWKKIAEWTMNDYNFFLGNSTVAIYALNQNDESYLREKLKEYANKLPKSVSYEIF